MQKIVYNEYKIRATAFQDEQGKWIGQAVVEPLGEERIRVQNPIVFDNERFNNPTDAEDFALDGVQFFIDTQLKDEGSE